MATQLKPSTWFLAVLIATTSLISACGGGGGGTTYYTAPVSTTGTIAGSVRNASTGAAVEGATVKASSPTTTYTATSTTAGTFTLPTVTQGTLVVKVSASGYEDYILRTEVKPDTTTTIRPELTPRGTATTIDIPTGGTVTVPSSNAGVTIPGGALAGTGNASVTVTPINVALSPGALPGDNSAGGLESLGAVTVTATDPTTGNTIPAATGGLFTIQIPVSSRVASPPATADLYYLDPTTGHWVLDTPAIKATLKGTAPNLYYEAQVPRLGTWSVDQAYETINATGCVVDQLNKAVEGATVTGDGIDFSGSTAATTDAAGLFRLPIKKDARAAITARSGGKTSNSVAVGPSAVDVAVGTGCLVLTDQSNNVTVRLTWGETPADVDGHLITPSGEHIYFDAKGDLTNAPWVNLDVDDTSSFGPEIVTVRKLQVGTYTYLVNNFTRSSPSHAGEPDPGLTASPVRVELNVSGLSTIYTPPAGETNASTWWTVFTMTVDSRCNVTIAETKGWSTADPTIPPASNAPVCTP
jgi:hypothetical protein